MNFPQNPGIPVAKFHPNSTTWPWVLPGTRKNPNPNKKNSKSPGKSRISPFIHHFLSFSVFLGKFFPNFRGFHPKFPFLGKYLWISTISLKSDSAPGNPGWKNMEKQLAKKKSQENWDSKESGIPDFPHSHPGIFQQIQRGKNQKTNKKSQSKRSQEQNSSFSKGFFWGEFLKKSSGLRIPKPGWGGNGKFQEKMGIF